MLFENEYRHMDGAGGGGGKDKCELWADTYSAVAIPFSP